MRSMRACARGISDAPTSSLYHAARLALAQRARILGRRGAARGEMRMSRKHSAPALAAGVAVGVATAICVHALRQPPAPSVRYVRVETDYSTYYRYLRTRIGPYYRHQHDCTHALPPSGLETLGHWTRRIEFACEKVSRG